MYPLDEILLLCLLAVLAGAETIVDIARFGEKKRALLRRFRPFEDGTPPQASHPCFAGAGPKLASPSHDHLGDILASLDAEAFQRCFVAWVGSLTGVATDVIAIDGKTVRRSYQKKGGTAPSTWSRPSRHASVWCSARSRWRKNPTRSPPSRSFSR